MANENNIPRFIKGRLVMLSRKNQKSGNILFYEIETINAHRNSYYFPYAGALGRGVPVLLTEDPKLKARQVIPLFRDFRSGGNRNEKEFWEIYFLMNEKIYVMYLSNKQYNHELVKAVPRRLTKDYSSENSKHSA